MIKHVLWTAAGVVLGLALLFLGAIAVELFSAMVYPFPPDFGGTQEEVCRHVERYPPWVLAVVVPAWGAAVLVSTWAARRTGGFVSAMLVGLLAIGGLVLNLSMLPYPLWFKIANLLVFPLAAYSGSKVVSGQKPAMPLPAPISH